MPATALLTDSSGLHVVVVDAGGRVRHAPVVVERDTGPTIEIAHLKTLRLEKKERKKAAIAKRKAREADKTSEAIMEKKPGSSTDVMKPE